MRFLRIAWRGAELALHLAFGALALAALRRVPAAWTYRGLRVEEAFVPWWYARACRVLRLRVRRRGRPTPLPALYAANHVSWLEVLALGSVAPMGFVAKSEVSRWPLIGGLAEAAGTLFLRRGSARAAARAVDQAVARLAGGSSVCVFPEGTSTAGGAVLPFKASLFEAASLLGCEVQPVAIFYPRADGAPAVAPFIGEDGFFSHLLRVLAEEEMILELSFLPAVQGHGRRRTELSSAAWQAVTAALAERRAASAFIRAEPPDVVPVLWRDSVAYGGFVRSEFRRPRAFETSLHLDYPQG